MYDVRIPLSTIHLIYPLKNYVDYNYCFDNFMGSTYSYEL